MIRGLSVCYAALQFIVFRTADLSSFSSLDLSLVALISNQALMVNSGACNPNGFRIFSISISHKDLCCRVDGQALLVAQSSGLLYTLNRSYRLYTAL